jgi:hypothetical protein
MIHYGLRLGIERHAAGVAQCLGFGAATVVHQPIVAALVVRGQLSDQAFGPVLAGASSVCLVLRCKVNRSDAPRAALLQSRNMRSWIPPTRRDRGLSVARSVRAEAATPELNR